jgi:excisionase family DNA binding protein
MDPRASMLTVPAAAGLVGVHEATFRRWCEDGKVRAVRLPSGRWRVDRRDIAALIIPGIEPEPTIGETCGLR